MINKERFEIAILFSTVTVFAAIFLIDNAYLSIWQPKIQLEDCYFEDVVDSDISFVTKCEPLVSMVAFGEPGLYACDYINDSLVVNFTYSENRGVPEEFMLSTGEYLGFKRFDEESRKLVFKTLTPRRTLKALRCNTLRLKTINFNQHNLCKKYL